MKIKIKTSEGEAIAELNETQTAREIYDKLPLEGSANVWGEEIYFDIPVAKSLEEPSKQEMEVGDLAYWSSASNAGGHVCIFFGKTPASIGEKPRAVSEVTFLGNVIDFPARPSRKEAVDLFKKVQNGERIVLTRLND